jgi:hypothetical protein
MQREERIHLTRVVPPAVDLVARGKPHLVAKGEDCGILRVVVEDTDHLQSLLERLAPIGRTATSMILSSPIRGRAMVPPGMGGDAE